MPDPIVTTARRFMRRLDEGEREAVGTMLGHYARIERRLVEATSRLQAEMEGLDAPTVTQLYNLGRYSDLLSLTYSEMSRLGKQLAAETRGAASAASEAGVTSAIQLGLMAASRAPGMREAFALPRTLAQAAAFVARDGPLYQRLRTQYGEDWTTVIAQQYVTGVALGWNPRRIARAIRHIVTTAVPADMQRIIRTTQLWTYRESNRNAWQQSGVVAGWIWHADLGSLRTCGSCWAMHGSFHPVTEVLDDHYNGRCAAVPVTSGLPGYPRSDWGIPRGSDAFGQLSPSRQSAVAHAGGWGAFYRAWRSGAVTFEQLSRIHADDVFGDMRVQASLVSILGDEAIRYYAR